MLIFTAVGLQIRPSGLILVDRTAVVGYSTCDGLATGADATTVIKTAHFSSIGTLFGCQRSAGQGRITTYGCASGSSMNGNTTSAILNSATVAACGCHCAVCDGHIAADGSTTSASISLFHSIAITVTAVAAVGCEASAVYGD